MNAQATQNRHRPVVRTAAAGEEIDTALPELIDVGRIEPHPDNPRQEFPADELASLAASLSTLTMLAPLQVQPGRGSRFQLLSGERRWRAAKLAGWSQVPCYVRRLSPAAAAQVLAEDNLQHRELNPVERARAIALLVRPAAEGGAGLTIHQVAERLGKDRSWVSNMLRILNLPASWQEETSAGGLCMAQARSLATFSDRQDVLAAVAAARAASPEDWQTRDQFEVQLAAVVARLDGLKASSVSASQRTVSLETHAPAEGDEAKQAPSLLSVRKLPQPQVSWLVKCIERITKLADLERLSQSLDARIEALSIKPRRRMK